MCDGRLRRKLSAAALDKTSPLMEVPLSNSLAHPLSSECGLHHGTAKAVLLPWVMEFNRIRTAKPS